jgi:predicted alpha/beta hydrolase family esterase
MSGAEDVANGLGRPRRRMLVSQVDHGELADVVLVAPLDEFAAAHRSSRRQFRFESLEIKYRKDLADRAADLVSKDTSLKYLEAADRVAERYNILIVDKRVRGN